MEATMTELSSADRESGSMTIVVVVLAVALAGLALMTRDVNTAQKATTEAYVALPTGGGACEVMSTEPDTKTYKILGKFSSEAEAKAAMATMNECRG
jgi:hypothetical protein